MVRVIMGVKGTGKTKQMIELINSAAKNESGSVVCIEHGNKLTYDIHYQIRLIEAKEYAISSFDMLKGFISGLHAGNFDISHIFIDNLCKVAHNNNEQDVDAFLNWLDSFANPINLKVTVTVSANPETATDTMRKYM